MAPGMGGRGASSRPWRIVFLALFWISRTHILPKPVHPGILFYKQESGFQVMHKACCSEPEKQKPVFNNINRPQAPSSVPQRIQNTAGAQWGLLILPKVSLDKLTTPWMTLCYNLGKMRRGGACVCVCVLHRKQKQIKSSNVKRLKK